MLTHRAAALACCALVVKFSGIAVELLTPPHEMEFEVIRAITPHEAVEVEERETEEEELDVLKPRKEREE